MLLHVFEGLRKNHICIGHLSSLKLVWAGLQGLDASTSSVLVSWSMCKLCLDVCSPLGHLPVLSQRKRLGALRKVPRAYCRARFLHRFERFRNMFILSNRIPEPKMEVAREPKHVAKRDLLARCSRLRLCMTVWCVRIFGAPKIYLQQRRRLSLQNTDTPCV